MDGGANAMSAADVRDMDELTQAMRAFDMFTIEERKRVLEVFATLKYPSITDRFFESVYCVICEIYGKKP